jgi:hypothetical protein
MPMTLQWKRMSLERAVRLYSISTPGILSRETPVYMARQPDWVLLVYQGVMHEYIGDGHAFIWRTTRDAEVVAATLKPRTVGRSLDRIGAADTLFSAKVSAESAAFDMGR